MEPDPQPLVDASLATTHQFRPAAATWLCAEGREAAMLLYDAHLDLIRKTYFGRAAAPGGEVILR